MSNRKTVITIFKLGGLFWKHTRYKKNGVWRSCYSTKHSYEPIFSKDPLNNKELTAILTNR